LINFFEGAKLLDSFNIDSINLSVIANP